MLVFGIHLLLLKQIKPFDINNNEDIIKMKKYLKDNLPDDFKIASISYCPNKLYEVDDFLIHEASLTIGKPVRRYNIGHSHWQYTGKYCDFWVYNTEYEWQMGKGKTIDEIDFSKATHFIKMVSEEANFKQMIECNIKCKDDAVYTISYLLNDNNIKEKTFTD